MSKLQWAQVRSGKVPTDKTDYTNFMRNYSVENDSILKYKFRDQVITARKNITQ